MSCPVFIGQGADWANTELLEVLVETSTNPAYSGIFGKFDEQSATVLADIRNTILVGGLKNIKMIQSNFSRD
jgi:small nuclear ribonucleoprotein (snRNP)-like protein